MKSKVVPQYVLRLVAEGRISTGRAAELLDVTVYDLYPLAEAHGVELGGHGKAAAAI